LKTKGIWMVASVLVVMGLLIGGFGCAAPAPAPAAPTVTVQAPAAPTVTVQAPAAPTVTVEAPAPEKPKYETLKLIYSSTWPEGNLTAETARAMANWITDQTDGAVTFDFYFAGALAAGKEHMNAFKVGLADFGPMATAYVPAEFPYNTLLELPYAAQYPDTMGRVAPILWEEFGAYRAEYTKNNQKVLLHMGIGPVWVHGNGPKVLTTADIDGKKWRVPGTIGKIFEPYGAIPVTTLGSEIYSSMEQGLVTGAFLQLADAKAYAMDEVATWSMDGGMGLYHNSQAVINLDRWNSLSPALQELFKEAEAWTLDWTTKWQVDVEVEMFKTWGVSTSAAPGGHDFYRLDDAVIAQLAADAVGVWQEIFDGKPDPAGAKAFFDRYVELAKEYDKTSPYAAAKGL
jgi:TRAP-type C4-dicarboxylate transport system substrate-binding protein